MIKISLSRNDSYRNINDRPSDIIFELNFDWNIYHTTSVFVISNETWNSDRYKTFPRVLQSDVGVSRNQHFRAGLTKLGLRKLGPARYEFLCVSENCLTIRSLEYLSEFFLWHTKKKFRKTTIRSKLMIGLKNVSNISLTRRSGFRAS